MTAREDITIKVGFGDLVKELTVNISDGDIPPYQPGDTFKVVGSRVNRVDGVAKVTGRAKYTYDKNLEGMIFGRIIRCPHANADVTRVNLEKARKMPGVRTAIDLTKLLGYGSIRYAWDGVAAVAADTESQAEEAARAVEIEYKVLPFSATLKTAMKEDAAQVGRGTQANVNPVGKRRRESEDDWRNRMKTQEQRCQRALDAADAVVQETFDTQVQTHCSLEPHGVVCTWEDDRLTCYASTQATFNCRREATSGRGPIGANDATVYAEYVGGGFGSKFGLGTEGVTGAVLAREAGVPVKMMLDRREEQTSTGNRPDSHQELSMGVDKDGTIKGYRVRSYGTAGSGTRGAGAHNDALYELGAMDKIEYGVRTNAGGARPMRAPGWPQGIFALESLVDMAAEKIGMDALEFRKLNDRHLVRSAEWDIGAQRIEWKNNRNRKPGSGKGHLKKGVGCGGTMWFAAGGRGAGCMVRIHKNGTVEVRNGAQDIGTGTRTIIGMVAAEELGLTLDDVQTYIGDTNDPRGPASGGSGTAPTLTPAARLAAHNAKRQLLEVVAEKMKWKADSLDLKDGMVVRKNGTRPSRKISFKQACAMMDEDVIEVNQDRAPNYRGESFIDTNSGVQFAEVEVDTETGEVRVTRVVAVQNCGKVINAKTAESQVRGGVIQGVSYALHERRTMDRHMGRMVNADMEMYKITGSVDCPDIDVVMLDVYLGKNNTSVMGLGEPPKIATAAAVANAVYNAIGARVTSLPITPKKVLEALAEKEGK